MVSITQQANLEKMLALVPSNAAAQAMVRTVWEFSDYQLFCVVHADDGRPSKYQLNVGAFQKTRQHRDLMANIAVRKTDRMEEAFVHELLHLDLARRGFPRVLAKRPTAAAKLPFVEGVQNLADHIIMLPTFLGWGYRQDRFLGHSRDPNAEEIAVMRHLEALDERSNPAHYERVIGALLMQHGVHFDCVSVAG